MRVVLGVVSGWLVMVVVTSLLSGVVKMGTIFYVTQINANGIPPEEKAAWLAGYIEKLSNFWLIDFPCWGIGALLAGWGFMLIARSDNGFLAVAVSLLMGGYAGLLYWGWPESVGPFLVVSVFFFAGAFVADLRRQRQQHDPAEGEDVLVETD